jgi:hypothetical protein
MLDADVFMTGVHQEVRGLAHTDHTVRKRWEILLKAT